MAGWLGILKSVPWGDVVSKAPQIAEGAKSLWSAVERKIRPADSVTAAADTDLDAQPLANRIAALDGRLNDLQRQLATSSDLIRSLAEQNTQLIARIDKLQRRQRWLTAGLVASGAAAVVALLLALNR